jgi:hypothetical protein
MNGHSPVRDPAGAPNEMTLSGFLTALFSIPGTTGAAMPEKG